MPQLTFSPDPNRAVVGMIADSSEMQIDSGLSSSRKLLSIAITASNSQTYTITINGTAFSYAADGSATTAEIAAGLVAVINAGSEPVHASGSDTPILLESTIDGSAGDFTYSDSAGTGALVETTLVAQSQAVPVGKYVCLDERSAAEDGVFPVRLPRLSTDITSQLHFGVVLQDAASEFRNSPNFRANTMLPVLRFGRTWVKTEQDIAKGDAVYVRYAAGGDGVGSFGNSAGSSERALLPNARYLSTALTGELVLVEVAK